MTAEERREREISDIYAKSPNWKPSRFIQARMRDAYDAGRSAGLEDAAQIAEHPYRLDGLTSVTLPTETGEAIAAAIRALKNKSLEPSKPGE